MQINIPFASGDGQAEKGLKNRGGIKTKSPQTGVCGDFFCDPTGNAHVFSVFSCKTLTSVKQAVEKVFS